MNGSTVERPVATGWVVFFAFAALYNLVIGIGGMLDPAAAPADRVVGLLVACFGILYALVAWAPRRLAPAIWAGVTGKTGVIILLYPAVKAGTVPEITGPLLIGDALFTIGFLAFLWRMRVS